MDARPLVSTRGRARELPLACRPGRSGPNASSRRRRSGLPMECATRRRPRKQGGRHSPPVLLDACTQTARRWTHQRLRRIPTPLRVCAPPGPASPFPPRDRPPAHLAEAAPHAGPGRELERATDAFAVSGLPWRRGGARGQASLPSGPASDLCRVRFPRSQALLLAAQQRSASLAVHALPPRAYDARALS